MRLIGNFIKVMACVTILTPALAQYKSARVFKLPQNAKYIPGKVLVKANASVKDLVMQLANGRSVARIKNVAIHAVAPVVKPELARQGAARMAPRVYKPKIDIARYFAIAFDPGRNIEDFINELYATGYFEIIEPEYEAHTDFTPNDPSISSQYYLNTVKALEAWNTTKGDTAVTIAIVDTGGLLTHPDLAANLYTNWAEYPPNGIDDDGNGFIDDYRGWDFIGADTLNLTNPNFMGDNNPNNAHDGVLGHATMVAGCASGVANNGVGIAGVGYKTRILFTKHTADNQLSTHSGIYSGYSGVLYAANLGIKIINCSWGSTTKSEIIQDLVNHVTLDLGSLIVSAAGNGGNATLSYPAAYDNVLSVAATDIHDKVANFSTFGPTVDLSAPGVSIYTTDAKGYITVDGTSFSSPITSGAAALVWAKNPGFSARQVAEQLRVSSDDQLLYSTNPQFANLLGRGRLNVEQAVTIHSPGLVASNPVMVSGTLGKTLLSFDFTNYLESTTVGLQISVTATNSQAIFTKSTISPGAIAGNSIVANNLNPFELTVNPNAPENTNIPILITYSDGTYRDKQNMTLVINPSFVDVASNKITTTVTNIGRVGFQDPSSGSMGQGFIINQENLLFEMGLMMGTSPISLYNNVRGVSGTFDQDFKSIIKINQISPGLRSLSEVSGAFSNSLTPAQQAIVVGYQSMVWKDPPYDKFVILEYKIKNPAATPLSNFYFGIFADWDISGSNDAADWNDTEKLGYVYPVQDSSKPFAGIQLLKGIANYYAIDNDQTIPGNPFGLYDDFTDYKKFATLTGGRLKAGVLLSTGGDVSHVVSSGPHTLAPGEIITIAYALHAAPNLNDLVTSAQWADSVYNHTLNATSPVGDSAVTCFGSTATLKASGPSKINWYTAPFGGASFFSGDQLTTGNLFNDTTLYVSNADSSFESVRTPMVVSIKANPKIVISGPTAFCDGNSVLLKVSGADSVVWSNAARTDTIRVSAGGNYSVTVGDTILHCHSSSTPVTVTVYDNPVADFVTTSALNIGLPVSFSDQSTGAVTWSWTFGDGTTSNDQNPIHTYSQGAEFNVTLAVTNQHGCPDSKTGSVSVVTGLEDPSAQFFLIYPNPATAATLQIEFSNPSQEEADLTLTNSLGEIVVQRKIMGDTKSGMVSLPVSSLSAGLYILRLRLGSKIIAKKVIKDR